MDKLILADGTIIELQTGARLSSLGVLSDSKEKMLEVWDALAVDNLKTVQIKDSEDFVVANYTNLVLVSETSTIQSDGMVLTRFNLREKTQGELDIEEIKADMQALNNTIGGTE